MKAKLEFNLPEDQEEFLNSINGSKYVSQIEEIYNQLVRPYFKHGYGDDKINQIINSDTITSEELSYFMDYLRTLYSQIVDQE